MLHIRFVDDSSKTLPPAPTLLTHMDVDVIFLLFASSLKKQKICVYIYIGIHQHSQAALLLQLRWSLLFVPPRSSSVYLEAATVSDLSNSCLSLMIALAELSAANSP